MELDQYSYIKLIKQLPKPTSIQIDNFINRLTFHHSWYKHLSENRIHDFIIYLDPNAGRTVQNVRKKLAFNNELVLKEESYCEFLEIAKDLDKSKYEQSYGYWKYFVPNENTNCSEPYLVLNIVNDTGLTTPIPKEIVEFCTIKLSRYIHECFSEDLTGDSYDGESPEIYIQKHEEIIKDLKSHMFSIVDKIYG